MKQMFKAVTFGLGLILSLFLAPVVSTASAQAFNYTTTGQFTGTVPTCNNLVAGPTATCSAGGLNLTFNGAVASAFGYTSGSQVTLGTFTPSGSGNETASPGVVNFTLFINQIMPSAGTGSTIGSLTGQLILGVGPSFSSLEWTPTSPSITIDAVNYALIFDQNSNSIGIGANSVTSIQAVGTVSTVPEPSTYALMAAGLAGLGIVARRRKMT